MPLNSMGLNSPSSPVLTPTMPTAARKNRSRKAPVVDHQLRLVNIADAVIASLKGAAEAVAAHDVAAKYDACLYNLGSTRAPGTWRPFSGMLAGPSLFTGPRGAVAARFSPVGRASI